MNSIFHRVSIRKFQDKPVEPEKIETLLRAAMAAPSARNQQPWEFYVVTNKDLIQKLSTVAVPKMPRCLSFPPTARMPSARHMRKSTLVSQTRISGWKQMP